MKTLMILLLAAGLGELANSQAQTLTTLYNFGSVTNGNLILDGDGPNNLIAGTDGNLYGTTGSGGTNGAGTVFKLTTAGKLTGLYSFCNSIKCPGTPEMPRGIVEGMDGNFYGTSIGGGEFGGNSSGGTVFKMTPQGALTILHSFCSLTNGGGFCADGTMPDTPLALGSDGNFYGTTEGGGSNGWGTVFQITPQGTLTTLYNFTAGSDGYQPKTPVMMASDGNIYGMMSFGGTTDNGLVYQITTGGTFNIVYSFCTTNGCLDGSGPLSSLIEVGGNLYGTTRNGGTRIFEGLEGGGIVFGMPLTGTPSGTLVPLYSFCNDGACISNGFGPDAGLVYGSDGNLYGTTGGGGGNDGGTLFQLTSEGQLTTLHGFCSETNGLGCVDGSLVVNTVEYPLVQAKDGNFYGIADGGLYDRGIVYKLDMGLGSIGNTNCTYALSATNDAVTAAGGAGSVNVTATTGCPWVAASNDGFITITGGSSGSGNGTVNFSVSANANSTPQMGTLTIAGMTFSVSQAAGSGTGSECTFMVSPASVKLTSKGGAKSLSVKAKGMDCAWTAVSNDPFITITAGDNGTGNGKVAFTVLGNTNLTALSGSITVAGETVAIDQAAGGCTFKLSPKAGKLKSNGGTGTVKVTPSLGDCTWTATSNDPFITITSDVSGVGDGVVTYSVGANTNPTVLTGSLTIGGQPFTVSVAGVK